MTIRFQYQIVSETQIEPTYDCPIIGTRYQLISRSTKAPLDGIYEYIGREEFCPLKNGEIRSYSLDSVSFSSEEVYLRPVVVATPKLVLLRETTLRDIPATLRNIAQAIEDGTYGKVTGAALVLDAFELEVFYTGDGEAGPNGYLLFCTAAHKILQEALKGKGE